MRASHLVAVAIAAAIPGCLVEPRCFDATDCGAGEICRLDGRCGFECLHDDDCGGGLFCSAHRCRTRAEVEGAGTGGGGGERTPSPLTGGSATDGPLAANGGGAAGGEAIADAGAAGSGAREVEPPPLPPPPPPPPCPEDMVDIGGSFCMDRFEASRPDATATSSGTDESQATSRRGVMPWQLWTTDENAVARSACQAAGKDLCSAEQWLVACAGPARTAYGYGDTYEPLSCNGIDTFGRASFHLLPTGSLETCQSAWGVYDLNGNLWEHVLDGSPAQVRGGAYNCSDSAALHRCDYVPASWTPTARGFRCCRPVE
jgi:hypothetical protein